MITCDLGDMRNGSLRIRQIRVEPVAPFTPVKETTTASSKTLDKDGRRDGNTVTITTEVVE